MGTGGATGYDPGQPDQGQPDQGKAGPSVTTLLPRLAGLRLFLARVPARQVLGGALVLLWAVWLIALWVTQPRLVPPDRLEDDLAQGRVTGYAVVVLSEDRSGVFDRSPALEVRPGPDDGRGQLSGAGFDEVPGAGTLTIAYWVDSRVADLRVLDPDRFSPSDLDIAADRLDEAGVEDRSATSFLLLGDNAAGTALAPLMFVGFLVVIAGPRPARGNRWFWFWLSGLPLGLGVLALAVFEYLRPPRPVVGLDAPTDGGDTASEHVATPQRLSGWAGFWAGIFGAVLITVVVDQIADVIPLYFVRP